MSSWASSIEKASGQKELIHSEWKIRFNLYCLEEEKASTLPLLSEFKDSHCKQSLPAACCSLYSFLLVSLVCSVLFCCVLLSLRFLFCVYSVSLLFSFCILNSVLSFCLLNAIIPSFLYFFQDTRSHGVPNILLQKLTKSSNINFNKKLQQRYLQMLPLRLVI